MSPLTRLGLLFRHLPGADAPGSPHPALRVVDSQGQSVRGAKTILEAGRIVIFILRSHTGRHIDTFPPSR